VTPPIVVGETYDTSPNQRPPRIVVGETYDIDPDLRYRPRTSAPIVVGETYDNDVLATTNTHVVGLT
jgi:predicted RNA-binding protein with TRAM domain